MVEQQKRSLVKTKILGKFLAAEILKFWLRQQQQKMVMFKQPKYLGLGKQGLG